MKRIVLTGILVLATGFSGLVAQSGKQAKGQKQAQAQQAPPAQPTGPAPKSPAEAQALQALSAAQNEGNPDTIIKQAEDLLTKFADTDFKDVVLLIEAQAYQRKGDADKAQITTERVLEVNPKNFQASLMLGELLAQHTKENDLDKEEKLTRAEKLINQTITDVNAQAKPNPQLTDAQWEEAKKYTVAEAHNALGIVGLDRKNYDMAVKEFTLAFEGDPQPAYAVRMASAQQSAGKNDEAIATCDKLLADPQLHPQIKQIAQAVRANAVKAKSAASAPPQGEKKQ